MLNTELWNEILQFDFDNPPAEYGFSIRLAHENNWTKNFTAQAILEYKKFMYLAATAGVMVSPSEAVDIVWHQHLLFTQSYQHFCNIIGSQVQHIPSTHNKEEFQKFKRAREQTTQLYEAYFREQPKEIWEHYTLYDSLHLTKTKFSIYNFIIAGSLSFLLLLIPFYYLLKPVYITIDNPYFIVGFVTLISTTFIVLEIINRRKFKSIIRQFDNDSFIYHLHPLELIYLKTSQLSHVINSVVNELVMNETITIHSDHTLSLSGEGKANTIEQLQTLNALSDSGNTFYPVLLKQLATKPVFVNIANSMNVFKKYFVQSKAFAKLFYINFSALAVVLLLGSIRLLTGMVREKPVVQITAVVIITAIVIVIYLVRLVNFIGTHTIPALYRRNILPTQEVSDDWQWRYFLLGNAVLATPFVPLVNYVNKNSNNNSGSCGTSCGSSCCSSCGSSCGGCGGD